MYSTFVTTLLYAALTGFATAITLTTSTSSYTVDTESTDSLVVEFSRSNCDITSIKFRGTEIQVQSGLRSHIASGFSSPSVNAVTLTAGGVNYVKVTCSQTELTHYYVLRNGVATVYMATNTTSPLPIGELRWVGRFINSVLPLDEVNQASDELGNSGYFEGADVSRVGSETRSKYYSSQRFIDDQVHCLKGSALKACMLIPGVAYETSSGGPFMRDM